MATLQTVSPASHPEYCHSCFEAGEKESEQTSAAFRGAEPRTGVLLFALAVAHGWRDQKQLMLIDSTVEAAPFYRRFFAMNAALPVGFAPLGPILFVPACLL